jgi:hypothetical protein
MMKVIIFTIFSDYFRWESARQLFASTVGSYMTVESKQDQRSIAGHCISNVITITQFHCSKQDQRSIAGPSAIKLERG